jgi:hypothetical protein
MMTFLAASLSYGFAQDGADVPANLKPPSDQHLAFRGHATGSQIYVCQSSANGNPQFAWGLSGPEATLTDDNGKEIAKHFAGPTWQSNDGSLVKGKVISQAAQDPNSIAWLMLTAVDHSGTGIMSNVSTIQRINTSGGKAPSGGCDAEHQGENLRVDYTADYYFYSPAK